jgi:hypothetical protein
MSEELCANCGDPADPGSGPVPLCPKCKSLAHGKERGVKMTPKPKSRTKRERRASIAESVMEKNKGLLHRLAK